MSRKPDVRHWFRIAAVAVPLLAAISCSHKSQPASPEASDPSVKHYVLTGRVIAIDKPNNSLTVDGDDIPGFMGAMQMPYDVKNPALLDKVAPGDKISADIVVKGDDSWLGSIRVTQAAPAAPKPSSDLNAARASFA